MKVLWPDKYAEWAYVQVAGVYANGTLEWVEQCVLPEALEKTDELLCDEMRSSAFSSEHDFVAVVLLTYSTPADGPDDEPDDQYELRMAEHDRQHPLESEKVLMRFDIIREVSSRVSFGQ